MRKMMPLKVRRYANNIVKNEQQTHLISRQPGVLARMFEALQNNRNSPPYKSNLFSLAGSKKILSGSTKVFPSVISPQSGVTRYNDNEYKDLKVRVTVSASGKCAICCRGCHWLTDSCRFRCPASLQSLPLVACNTRAISKGCWVTPTLCCPRRMRLKWRTSSNRQR